MVLFLQLGEVVLKSPKSRRLAACFEGHGYHQGLAGAMRCSRGSSAHCRGWNFGITKQNRGNILSSAPMPIRMSKCGLCSLQYSIKYTKGRVRPESVCAGKQSKRGCDAARQDTAPTWVTGTMMKCMEKSQDFHVDAYWKAACPTWEAVWGW